MPILGAMQSAAIRLVGHRPVTFFSASHQFEMEIVDLAGEVARDVAKSHDWQALIRVHTMTGDGEATSFPLPDDYDRMLIKSDVQDALNWAWGYQRIDDINEFIYRTNSGFNTITPGSWMIFDNRMQFVPAPPSGAEAVFPYITRNIARSESGTPQASFSGDQDEFVLDDRLLTLGLVWKWREQKRLDATGDQANFEKAFAEIAGRDKGSRIIRTGRPTVPGSVRLAYPHALGS